MQRGRTDTAPHALTRAASSDEPGLGGFARVDVPGRFKIRNQRGAFAPVRDPLDTPAGRRVRRILSSIRRDVDEGSRVRIRQILRSPRELYRIELELPEMSYERTTIVDADTLETLIEETPEHLVRERFVFRS